MGSIENSLASITPARSNDPCELQVDRPEQDTLQVHLKENCTLAQKLPSLDELNAKLTPGPASIG